MGPEYQVHVYVQCDLLWTILKILDKILSQLPNRVILWTVVSINIVNLGTHGLIHCNISFA